MAPRVPPRLRLLLACLATAALLVPIGLSWHGSLLPESYDPASMGYVDSGGGAAPMHHTAMATPVASLVGDTAGRTPDVAVTLTARREGNGYTVNGQSPGPVLRARQGDLVQVTLRNDNVRAGTTLHWHGIDVPNAMDGVAGVTQDAVMPGQSFTYRFVARDAGTYWYHSHQVSHEQVRQGLFGVVVITPRTPLPVAHDLLAVMHSYGTRFTVNGQPGTQAASGVQPGDRVRVRVVNTDNFGVPLWVSGAPYTVAAIDGRDLNKPSPVSAALYLTAGGRADLELTVPAGGARVELGGKGALTLGGDPGKKVEPRGRVDLLSYGKPAPLGFDPGHADRHFEYRIGRRLGFLDGRPGRWWTINGHLFPDVPMFMVSEGDVVVMDIRNSSGDTHPMHLHGHHAVVLSRDGVAATGSPWWVDSLDVPTGHRFRIAFVADNPGIWMDHCHNLPHAAEGLVTHLMYDGVRSSFRIGGKPGNEPE